MRNARFAIVALIVLAVPLGASAATTVSNLTSTLEPKKTLGSNDCSTTYRFDVSATLNGQPVTDIASQIGLSVATSNACSGGTAITATATALAGKPGTFEFTLTGSQIFAAAFPGSTCPGGEAGQEKKVFLCGSFANQGEGEKTVTTSQEVDISTALPGQPTITSVAPGDRALFLDFQPAQGAGSPANWRVCFQQIPTSTTAFAAGEEPGAAGSGGTAGDAGTGGTGGTTGEAGTGGTGGTAGEEGTGGTGGTAGAGGTGGTGGSEIPFSPDHCNSLISGQKRSFKLEGLQNFVTYQVAIAAVDSKGNESPFSDPVRGTPIPSDSFWERYKELGGEQQGCASTTGAATGMGLALAALSILTISRKRAGR